MTLVAGIYYTTANGDIYRWTQSAFSASTLVIRSGLALTDLAFDPEGRLYGITADALYRMDATTGSSVLVAALGGVLDRGATAGWGATGFDIAPDGVALATSRGSTALVQIDLATGSMREAGRLPVNPGGDLALADGRAYVITSNGMIVLARAAGTDPATPTYVPDPTVRVGPIGTNRIDALVAAFEPVAGVATRELLAADFHLGRVFALGGPDNVYDRGPVGWIGAATGAALLPGDVTPEPVLPDTGAVLAARGELQLLADLALAAYHLAPGEPTRARVNDPNAAGTARHGEIGGLLHLLTASDLPGLAPVTGGGKFPVTGLRDGIYTNRNAAALVARSDDALFIGFRGTNDNGRKASLTFEVPSPDMQHWVPKGLHYRLFQPLFAALDDWLNDAGAGIGRIYVAGHSLGAAMVEAFLGAARTGDLTVRAASFASPGFDGTAGHRGTITALKLQNDPIWKGEVLAGTEIDGDVNTIVHGLPRGPHLHSMTLYDAFVGFMAGEGIGRDALSGRAWHGIDHDRILIAATTNAARDRFAIATGDDGLTGTRHDEIVLGGPGRDTLTGRGGRDHIAGGTDADVLRGEAGGDFLFGGAGDDVLDGGRGADRLDGGAGADRFVFAATADSTPRAGAADRITDFSAPQGDLIDLSAIDADTGRRGDQPFRLIGDRPFSGAAGELRAVQRGDDTRLTGDTDGDGRADLLILLSGAPVLSAADVLL